MKMKEDLIRSLGKNVHHHHKADSSALVLVGNKVLPICDSTSSSSSSSSSSMSSSCKADDQQQQYAGQKKIITSSSIKEETNNNNNNLSSKSKKTLSRMKELLRWAAASKSDRVKLGAKVLHSRNKSATMMKTGGLDEEISKNNESPKISMKWEVESCDTSCSAPPSIRYDESSPHRTGNWITTDDEFVVLEL